MLPGTILLVEIDPVVSESQLDEALLFAWDRVRKDYVPLRDLDSAILELDRAIEVLPDTYLNRALYFNTHACAFRKRFQLMNNLDDLHLAIASHRLALGEPG